ncbi:hypothetical protein THAOC_03347 [Thalassiosira oceanica]|uniref:Uncharacterized protein n=1 Tax=Thalassiosira oceanica TaxID=159749 RepID=K0TL28_THAOC|nr:hypothetical protein THAOC_03347 [Thalassiosira oceanica]|eukprot:EJK74946.1 hypothetical protein THAOC_03347 [Thalassiosira oceanica]
MPIVHNANLAKKFSHSQIELGMNDQDDLHLVPPLPPLPPSRKRTAPSSSLGPAGKFRTFRLAPRPEPFEHMASAVESPTTIIADANECLGFEDLTLQGFAAGSTESISSPQGASNEATRPSGPAAWTAARMTPMTKYPPPLRANPPRARLVQRRRAASSTAMEPAQGVVTLEVMASSGGLLFPKL